jgi:CBS domain-containing protein
MKIADLMSTRVVTIAPEESAALAARLLSRYNLGALPVCGGDGRLRGMVTDRDIVLRCVAPEEDPARTAVETIMTRGCLTVGPEDAPQLAARRMAQGQVRRLPVVREGVLVGMVSLTDLVRAGRLEAELSRTLTEITDPVRKPPARRAKQPQEP